jgi:hypothetical protein
MPRKLWRSSIHCNKQHFLNFNNYYIKTTENIKANGRYPSEINFLKDVEEDLLYIHSPKLLLIWVFSAVGGLISMWFGIDLFRFTTCFFKMSFEFSLKFSIFHSYCGKTFARRETMLKIIKYFLFLLSFSLMSYQIIEIVQIYSMQESIARIEVFRIKLNKRFNLLLILCPKISKK